MDDLIISETSSAGSLTITIHHIRVLRMVARGQGEWVKLPLRFKFEHQLVDELVEGGTLERGLL